MGREQQLGWVLGAGCGSEAALNSIYIWTDWTSSMIFLK